jgi:hypothetical protein
MVVREMAEALEGDEAMTADKVVMAGPTQIWIEVEKGKRQPPNQH